jgi:ParB family chromosome partitioning protein
MAAPAKGLGRGLSALMGDTAPVALEIAVAAGGDQPVNRLPVGALRPGKYQPRRRFDEETLTELADSIDKHGLMQPIVVRAIAAGGYEIIAGERRWRASKLANLLEVPVIVREVGDAEALELGLIENIQRADLNPLEEAAGYQRLMDEFGYTQEKLAPVVGKSRSHIANLLRLLKLPEVIKRRIDAGELSMGHARALLVANNPEELAERIAELGLTVRQAEDLARGGSGEAGSAVAMAPVNLGAVAAAVENGAQGGAGQGAASGPGKAPERRIGTSYTTQHHARPGAAAAEKSDDVLQLEAMLSDSLGLPVSINTRGAQTGEVVVGYGSLTQLDEILRRLGGSI